MIPLHSGDFAIHYPFHSSSVQFSLEELVPNWVSLHVQLGLGVSFWALTPFLFFRGCPLQDKRNTIIKVPQATAMIPLHSGGFAIHYPFHSSSVQFSLEEWFRMGFPPRTAGLGSVILGPPHSFSSEGW
ncbi:hypothetical protein CEXT_249411 [Caerostris extrusa]|uniref:Cytochrome c biogenesis B n=1 Tax=Caerostris extrusa TaxID=172846 RepID=A0AAV4QHF9_CAEEX|nr:hypothetical protein CEXT_249411 [Caerostris extrusa]